MRGGVRGGVALTRAGPEGFYPSRLAEGTLTRMGELVHYGGMLPVPAILQSIKLGDQSCAS